MRGRNALGVAFILIFYLLGIILMGEAIKDAAEGYRSFTGTSMMIAPFIFLIFWIWELQKEVDILQEKLKSLINQH